MSTIAIAILTLLLLGSTSVYYAFRLGLPGKLGLVLVGPCFAAALWCLWWSA
jgi:hypothetical protein